MEITRRRTIREYLVHERLRMLDRNRKFVGKRQHIENSKSPAQQSLAAVRIPGKSQARLEIPKRGVSEKGRSHNRSSVGKIAQIGKQIMRLGWHSYHFIAQSGVERQVFFQPDVILNIGAE